MSERRSVAQSSPAAGYVVTVSTTPMAEMMVTSRSVAPHPDWTASEIAAHGPSRALALRFLVLLAMLPSPPDLSSSAYAD